jgi:hypothetical protein
VKWKTEPRRCAAAFARFGRANTAKLAGLKGGGKKLFEIGGADGIRTHDLLDAIEARSQLRHGPTEGQQRMLTFARSVRL